MKEKLYQQKVVFLCGLEMPLKVGGKEVKGGSAEVNLHWSRAWRSRRMEEEGMVWRRVGRASFP